MSYTFGSRASDDTSLSKVKLMLLQTADLQGTIRRMGFTTQWRAAFRVKCIEAAVIRRKWLEEGEKGEGERGEGGEAVVGD